jgi:nitroimidazol reductase NimA-like FMN-containing flavoprotein (pyridoxamine 5'-phosphate oxidase superfamily)
MDARTPKPVSPPSPRMRVRRLPKRGHYDRETIHAVLDAGTLCHIGYVVDGQPFVTPTLYWRHGDKVYWHGSAASRMLRSLDKGVPACLTVTHMDGFVLARSGFHHSINYRSVMAVGTAYAVRDKKEKLAHLEEFVERLFPGRWREIREPSEQELKATLLLGMSLDEASAKIRTGGPIDDEPDYALPCWAGVLPLSLAPGKPVPDQRLAAGTPLPAYLKGWTLGV